MITMSNPKKWSDMSDWQPTASIATLHHRAKLLDNIRLFFKQRNYLEVETPILSHYGISDVYLANITCQFRKEICYLHTSPEYAMKRLLAAGSGPIFQITKVFRDDELGRWHNPEFTLLEWYQLGINHHELMNEVDDLLKLILNTPSMRRITYQQAFEEIMHINPHHASINDFQKILKKYDLDNVISPTDSNSNNQNLEQDRDLYLYLCMSHIIEPALATATHPTAIYDFPASQAALARLNPQGYAERFEVYYQGVELANGFHELSDVNEQRQRFEIDNQQRLEKNLPIAQLDPYFLSALEHGLPHCSGVALGIDRLISLSLNQKELKKSISFDFSHM